MVEADSQRSEAAVVTARQGLHTVAEHLLAGPQWRTSGTIRLAVTPGGFATTRSPAPGIGALEVRGDGLFREPDGLVAPLAGPIPELAKVIGVDPGPPVGVYPEVATQASDEPLELPRFGVDVVLSALSAGDRALRALVAAAVENQPTEPVLWPEHFDLGLSLDEVNYGISPGDDGHPRPYVYVGPWQARRGAFWNESFGASRALDELDDVAAITAFLLEGRARAAADPRA
jgi:hypothetical protein